MVGRGVGVGPRGVRSGGAVASRGLQTTTRPPKKARRRRGAAVARRPFEVALRISSIEEVHTPASDPGNPRSRGRRGLPRGLLRVGRDVPARRRLDGGERSFDGRTGVRPDGRHRVPLSVPVELLHEGGQHDRDGPARRHTSGGPFDSVQGERPRPPQLPERDGRVQHVGPRPVLPRRSQGGGRPRTRRQVPTRTGSHRRVRDVPIRYSPRGR
mmetsp:Transcript_24704/g.50079  ORF Transcript_24704/g.50079 Transcript_24704/m.50079 type:complete len:213 (+) Transcript_24704:128-766(+)